MVILEPLQGLLAGSLGMPAESVATFTPGWILTVQDIAYLVAAIFFILGIKQLASPKTARRGNGLAAIGMLVAIVATLYTQHVISLVWVFVAMIIGGGIGAFLAVRIQMTAMPQLVAAFNGFGGLASILVASSEYFRRVGEGAVIEPDQGFTMGLSALIGSVTFTGSFIAFAKLQGVMSGRPRLWPGQQIGNFILFAGCIACSITLAVAPEHQWVIIACVVLASLLGVTLTIAIGGADMPVMVALLNSYSGLAAAATGFILDPPNKALIVSGSLVGASGIILTMIMCRAMNRSLANVLFGGVGTDDSSGGGERTMEDRPVRSVDPDELAILLDGAQRVIIVPGYGMAVAQAQHAVRDLVNKLEAQGCECLFGIHPVAGRMPGHMNVLLAEVDIPYDKLLDLDGCNPEFERTDIALVIGANDVVNPSARHDKSSPIYGMPILDVDKAQTVVVCKRSLGAGYAGVQNELFFQPNTLMMFGDAKKTISALVSAIDE